MTGRRGCRAALCTAPICLMPRPSRAWRDISRRCWKRSSPIPNRSSPVCRCYRQPSRSSSRSGTAPKLEYPRELCMHELVEAQAARTPNANAVEHGSLFLTYRELNQRANQLAHFLQKRGIGPESKVGICLRRSLELPVSFAGGAQVRGGVRAARSGVSERAVDVHAGRFADSASSDAGWTAGGSYGFRRGSRES